MNMQGKVTHMVMVGCMSLSLLAACNPNTPNNAQTPNTNSMQATLNSNSSVRSSLATQAQLALANYHDVDASFHDTSKLSNHAGFKTQLLGGVVNDVVDEVVDVIDRDDNDNDNDSNTNSNTNVNAGVNANVGTTVNTDSDTDASAGLNLDASADVNSNVNTGTNVAVNTRLDADTNALRSEMDSSRQRLSTDLMANGAVSVDTNGNATVNDSQLRTNVETMIGGSAEADVLENLNIDAQVNSMTRLSEDALIRLEGRGFTAMGGQLQSQNNNDGTLTEVFGLQLQGNGSERSIISANRLQNDSSLGLDLVLRENGEGFTREANRMSRITAQGNLNVVTRSETQLANGGSIEIFEERVTDMNGDGVGNGFITLTSADGEQESFDFSTMVKADGSLVSRLGLEDDDTTSALVLRESASGQASLSVLGDNQEERERLNLDFNAMLDAMGDLQIS